MKKLFLYYSLTGNGDLVANYLETHGYELRKVVEKQKMPKSFFWRVFVGGFRAGVNMKAKLVDYNNDVSEYDEIVIGSPVWNSKFPPALNSVLAETDFTGKKLTFLFYSGSGDTPKAAQKVYKLFPEADIYSLKEPKTHDAEFEKIKEL